MFQDAFIKLNESETTELVKEINTKYDGTPLDPERTTILYQALSFYPGYRFLDIVDERIYPLVHKYAFYKPDDLVFLNWTNAPVYQFNDRAPLSLNAGNVVDYVKFFFSCVRGRKGHFIVVESVDEVTWKEDPPIAARKAIGKIMTPVHITKENENGSFELKACMVFKDSLFSAKVTISKEGHVDLSEEELLIEDLPVLEDTLE